MFEPQKYWENRFNHNPSLNTTGYLGMGTTYNRWLYRSYIQGIRRLLQKHHLVLNSQKRVFDAGAGSGFLESFCQTLGVQDLQAIDFTTSAIHHLKESFPNYSFFQWDLTQPFSTTFQPADFTFCISVLYHIVHEKGFETALKNLTTLTKPSGYLIIADNFMPKEPSFSSDSPQRHWSKERYEQILKSLGFEIIEYQPIFFLLNAPIRFQETYWGGHYLNAWIYVQKIVAGNPWRERGFSPFAYWTDFFLQRFFSFGPSSHYLLARKSCP